MGKSIIPWPNLLFHGQIYYPMATFIIPWPNLLFHGHYYYSRCNLLFPWANSYYCMRKSLFYFMRNNVICVPFCKYETLYFHVQNFAQAHHGYTYTQALTYNTFCICMLGASLSASGSLAMTRQRCGAGKKLRRDAGTRQSAVRAGSLCVVLI